MIEHLKGRERALAALGWTGREAEWIALVCLHSGVFTRPQFCHYFDTQRKQTASRFVKALVARRAAVESDHVTVRTVAGGRAGFPGRRFTGRSESRTSATGETLERRLSCGGFSRLILSWNIRA